MSWIGRSETTVDNPHEVWTNNPYHKSGESTWVWRVLKKWQKDDSKENARWFVAVKSPLTGNWFECGDEYVSNIKDLAVRIDETHEQCEHCIEHNKWLVEA